MTSNTTKQPQKLYQQCKQFVANHLHWIDSFQGFPALIAHELVVTAVHAGVFVQNNPSRERLLRMLDQAYCEEELLTCLNCRLGNAALSVLPCVSGLRQLDLSHCHIAENPVLTHVFGLKHLQVLLLSDNGLTDSCLRRLTAPRRYAGQGASKLHALNLSDNALTKSCVQFLKVFEDLKLLDLTGTAVQASSVCVALGMEVGDCWSLPEVQNRGWLQHAFAETTVRAGPRSAASCFYGAKRQCRSCAGTAKHMPRVFVRHTAKFEKVHTAVEINGSGSGRIRGHHKASKRDATTMLQMYKQPESKRNALEDDLLSLYGPH